MMKHKKKLIGIGLATLMVVSVIAMTGAVSAAPTVKAAAGSAPTGWYRNPVMDERASPGSGYGAAVVSSTDGKVYATVDADALNPLWVSLGKPGTIQSNPTAVYDPSSDNVVVFVATTDGSIWAKAVDAGTLKTTTVFDWTRIAPGVCAPGTGPGATVAWIGTPAMPQVALFYIDTSNALEYMWANLPTVPTMGWRGPTGLGGYLTSSPSACARDTNVIDVFARGQSGGLWSRDYGAGGFGGWYEVPGFGYLLAGTGPAAVAYQQKVVTVGAPVGTLATSMYVFVTGGSDQVYYQYWCSGGIPKTTWNPNGVNIGNWNVATDLDNHLLSLTGYVQVTGSTTSSTPAAAYVLAPLPNPAGAVPFGVGQIAVAIKGGDNYLWGNAGPTDYPIDPWQGWYGPVINMS